MERELPYSLEAERAVLGSVLINPDMMGPVARLIKPEDFYEPEHRAIFSALLGLNGKPADLVVLVDYLRQMDTLDKAGGEGYLVGLIGEIPTSYRAESYARIVAERAQARRLIHAATEITKLAYYGNPQDALGIIQDTAHNEAERSPSETPWSWSTLKSAYEPKEPRRYVVPGLLPMPSLSIVYGTPGSLKTMLLQDLAICVSSGTPWLTSLPHNPEAKPYPIPQPEPVLWIDVDNGLDRLERRFAAMGRAYHVKEDAPIAYTSFPSPPFAAGDPKSVQVVLDKVLQDGAKLIVFDNLGTISGGADENSSQMVGVMSGLRQIAELGGCAVVVIHHKSKGTRDRPGDSLRGHSSIEGAVDLALLVEREENGDTVTVRSTKTRDTPVESFAALWTYEQDRTGELAAGRFFGMGRPEQGSLSRQEQAEMCILKDMTNGMNQTQIVELAKEKAGVGRNTTLAAIHSLVENGHLHARVGQPSNAVEYDKAA
jgi:hypothetical protein